MKTLIPWLAGLAVTPAAAAPVPAEIITYRTGACFGRCPIYEVTVRPDGRATFRGITHTAVTGIRAFRVTRAQYLAFAHHLAPARPARSIRYAGRDTCREMATDLPSAEVTWSGPNGERTLFLYYGCDLAAHRALVQRLRTAPGLLPIGDFIGPRR